MIALMFLMGMAFATQAVSTGGKHQIDGEVFDENDKPIPAVLVRAYRQGRKIAEAWTNKEGKYSLSYAIGDRLVSVTYEHSDWYSAEVANISGRRSNSINKVLLPIGSALNKQERIVVIAAYQRLRELADGDEFAVIKTRHGPAIRRLCPTDGWDASCSDLLIAYGVDSRNRQPVIVLAKADLTFLTESADTLLAHAELAKLARERASTNEVRQLAQTVENDSAALYRQVREIALKKGADVPEELSEKEKRRLEPLQSLSGDAFDRMYLKQVVEDQRKFTSTLMRQSEQLVDSDVRQLASKTLPRAQNNLQYAESLTGSQRARKVYKDATAPERTQSTKDSEANVPPSPKP